jgi:pilus assembly protein Flp/PilA
MIASATRGVQVAGCSVGPIPSSANSRPSDASGIACSDKLRTFFSNFTKDQSGVTAIEYALIAALIAVAAIAAFTLVGTNLSTTFSTHSFCLSGTHLNCSRDVNKD